MLIKRNPLKVSELCVGIYILIHFECEANSLTVICRLETYIGNILDWKHQNRLETKFLDWKHDYEIGNKKKYIGNNEFRLETKFVDWKQ